MPPSNRKIRARLSSEGGNTRRPSRPYRPTPSMLPAFLNSSLLSSLSLLLSFLPPLAFFYFSKRYARPNRTSKSRSFYGRICNFKLAVLCHHQRSKRFPHREISWVFFFLLRADLLDRGEGADTEWLSNAIFRGFMAPQSWRPRGLLIRIYRRRDGSFYYFILFFSLFGRSNLFKKKPINIILYLSHNSTCSSWLI